MRQTPTASILAALAAAVVAALPSAAAARPAPGARTGPWSVELVDDSGAVLPTFEHRGRTYVLGKRGRRYAIRIRNGSAGRIEAVVSVDGRDAVDGRPSALAKRGYVVDAWGEALVDGFRLSDAAVAAFRFGTVASSYAARMGDARDVGVVGVAVFAEAARAPQPLARDSTSLGRERGPEASAEAAPPPAGPRARPGEAQAKASPGRSEVSPSRRPGLGTEFGEERDSAVARVRFERASAAAEAVLTLRYDDRAGLVALGIDVDGRRWSRRDEAWRRERAEAFRRDASYAAPPPGWRP